MKKKENFLRIVFPSILTITLFSYWAGFALLFVNNYLYKDLPGYTIGRICIWEVVVLILAIIISQFLIRKWGNISIVKMDGRDQVLMNPNFGIYFAVYFLIAVIVGIWQFYLFSLKF